MNVTSMNTTNQISMTTEDSKRLEYTGERYIVPLEEGLLSKRDVIDALYRRLVNDDEVVEDVLSHIRVQTVNWYYLPMMRFDATVRTEWSCKQIVVRQREVGKQPVKDREGNIVYESIFEQYAEFIPHTGQSTGDLSLLVSCADKGLVLREAMSECYSSVELDDIILASVRSYSSVSSFLPAESVVYESLVDSPFMSNRVDIDIAINEVAEYCSFGSISPEERCEERIRSEVFHTSKNGDVFFLPFVEVLFEYKGQECQWAFLQTENIREATISFPCGSCYQTQIQLLQEYQVVLQQKERLAYFVSCLSILGRVFYGNSIVKDVLMRLETQKQLVRLQLRLKRQESLISRNGSDVKLVVFNLDDGMQDKLPSTIKEIDRYFAETEVMRKEALSHCRNWLWISFFFALIMACFIGVLLGNCTHTGS